MAKQQTKQIIAEELNRNRQVELLIPVDVEKKILFNPRRGPIDLRGRPSD